MLRSLSTIALGILLTVLGLLAGWQLSSHVAPMDDHDEHAHDDHDHDDHADDDHDHDDEHADDHDHEHDDHEDEDHAELSEQTLKTLGVVIEHARLQDYVRTVDVRAVLVDRPENRRTVVTPMGGIVRRVDVESGQVVDADAPLVSLVRDPIAVGEQSTAMGIVLPERKHLIESLAALRSARTDLDIANREIARLEKLGEGTASNMPELFASRLRELRYERSRAERRATNAESELHHHGLDEGEIAHAAAGGEHPPLLDLWRRTLKKHGAWGDLEEKILAQLPAEERVRPWPVLLLAELSMQGLVRPGLLELVSQQPRAAERFREVAALLLEGYSIENVLMIAKLGGLDPDLVIRAPDTGGEHWDLERLRARVGLHLQPGDPVAELYDPRRLWLRLEPIGGEIEHVRRAVQEHLSCQAVPVLRRSAPDLPNVHFRRLASHEERGTVAYAEIDNHVLLQESGRRSWSLQAGTEFLVRVPLETMPGRFVLPVDAIVRDGPDRIVYVLEEDHDHDHEGHDEHDDHDEDHDEDHAEDDHDDHDDHDDDHHHGMHFYPVPVHVELDTKNVVVIAADGALLEGQEVVVHGAFALHLALQQGRGEPDAGHGHSHH